jgi:hypothetical protein
MHMPSSIGEHTHNHIILKTILNQQCPRILSTRSQSVLFSPRAIISLISIDGRAVTEFEPSGKTAREIQKLLEWVDKVMS